MDPQGAIHHRNLGSFLSSFDQYDDAEMHLKKAIELDGTDLRVVGELGVLYLRMGKWVEGLTLLHCSGLQKMPPSNPWHGESLDNKSICIHAQMGLATAFFTPAISPGSRNAGQHARLRSVCGTTKG